MQKSRWHDKPGQVLFGTEFCEGRPAHSMGALTTSPAVCLSAHTSPIALLPIIPTCTWLSSFKGQLKKQVEFRSDLPPSGIVLEKTLKIPLESKGILQQTSMALISIGTQK